MRPAVVAAILVLGCVLDTVTARHNYVFLRGCGGFRSCGAGWSRINSTRCIKYVRLSKTFDDAQKHCRALNNDLVSIPNHQEMKNVLCLMRRFTRHGQSIWTGAKRSGTVFRYTDGSAFTFTNWAHGEPNNFGGREDCVAMANRQWRQFSDENCSTRRHFVCAKKI